MAGRILIIEPDLGNRLLLKGRLLGAYYAVEMLSDPADAAALALASRCDLVFLAADAGGGHLPLLRQLKSGARTAHLPVILMPPLSASGRADLLAGWLAAGADDILRPDGSDPVLLAKIRMFVRLKQMHDDFHPPGAELPDSPPAPAGPAGAGGGDNGPGRVFLFDPLPDRQAQGIPAAAALLGRTIPDLRRTETAHAMLSAAAAWPAATVALDMTGPRRAAAAVPLIARLRADPATRFTPVLMLAGPGQDEAVAQGFDLGASDLLRPDMDPAELRARLAALDRRRGQALALRAALISGLRLALTDPLTGLNNRRHALAHVPRLMAGAAGSGRPFALMILDIDRFKRVNDRYGHACGDRVLAAVAARLAGAVRRHDLVARIGGEEFLVAMPGLGPAQAAAAADRLRLAVAGAPVATGSGLPPLEITVSAGIAVSGPDAPVGFEALFAAADGALLRCKRAGRNCVRLAPQAA